MEKQAHKKFGWKIKNFSSIQAHDKCCSIPVLIGDCKWRLLAYPKGHNNSRYFSLYLDVVDSESLPYGWGRYVKLRVTLVNHDPLKHSAVREIEHCFDSTSTTWGFHGMLPFSKLLKEDGGFLVNGVVMIFAELDVIEVVGTLDESEKPEEVSEILSKKDNECAESNCLVKKTSPEKESNDVNGTKKVQSVMRHIFERHPDMALEFHAKNEHMRTTFMNFLLGLIESLYQPLQELSTEDLVEADIALTYLKDVGFKVDWLEKKLDQLKEKKEKELSCEARVKVMEAQLHELKHKLETEKAELLATRGPLSFEDVV